MINVPVVTQDNGLLCGPTSLYSMLNYLGSTLSLEAIANISRCSHLGTMSKDLIRTVAFNSQDTVMGNFYPHISIEGVFKGFVPLVHEGELDHGIQFLKNCISNNKPVVVLQHFSTPTDGLHYRVIVDIDDNKVTCMDPWGRSNRDSILEFSLPDFKLLWNATDIYADTPYFAVTASQLKVESTLNRITMELVDLGNSIKTGYVVKTINSQTGVVKDESYCEEGEVSDIIAKKGETVKVFVMGDCPLIGSASHPVDPRYSWTSEVFSQSF